MRRTLRFLFQKVTLSLHTWHVLCKRSGFASSPVSIMNDWSARTIVKGRLSPYMSLYCLTNKPASAYLLASWTRSGTKQFMHDSKQLSIILYSFRFLMYTTHFAFFWLRGRTFLCALLSLLNCCDLLFARCFCGEVLLIAKLTAGYSTQRLR